MVLSCNRFYCDVYLKVIFCFPHSFYVYWLKSYNLTSSFPFFHIYLLIQLRIYISIESWIFYGLQFITIIIVYLFCYSNCPTQALGNSLKLVTLYLFRVPIILWALPCRHHRVSQTYICCEKLDEWFSTARKQENRLFFPSVSLIIAGSDTLLIPLSENSVFPHTPKYFIC